MFDESCQVVASRNGCTILKPHWMSQEYWQNYEVPRVGKRYGKILYGARVTSKDVDEFRQESMSAEGGECTACNI